MTVAELRDKLERLPDDDEVFKYEALCVSPVTEVYHETTFTNHYVVIS